MKAELKLMSLLIFLILGSCQQAKIFKRKIRVNQLTGVWEISEVYPKGKKEESINVCGYREEILLNTDDNELVELEEHGIKGKIIGKSNFRNCMINPVSYEYEITHNSCYNLLIQDIRHEKTWYELGEIKLVEYEVSFDGTFITLKEVKDFFYRDRVLQTIKLKKTK